MKLRIALITCLVLGLLAAPALAATNSFTDAAANDDWNTAGNWSLGHIPTASEDVVVSGTRGAVIPNGTAAVANSITETAGIQVSGSTLTVGAGTSSLTGTISTTNSTFTLGGATTVADGTTLGLDGSTLDVKAALTFAGAGNLARGNSNPGLVQVESSGSSSLIVMSLSTSRVKGWRPMRRSASGASCPLALRRAIMGAVIGATERGVLLAALRRRGRRSIASPALRAAGGTGQGLRA